MRLSCVIRAHPDRTDLVDSLLDRLGPVPVVWDEGKGSWETGIRAWQAYDPAADWHLVIEDDAIVCRDLLAGVEQGLEDIPSEAVVSLYLGDRTGTRDIAAAVQANGAGGSPWLTTQTLVWGVAIALPVPSIRPMLDWTQLRFAKTYGPHVYDTRIARYYAEKLHWPAYYAWPSLVDHRTDEPSLLGHVPGRRARRFIGQDASAVHDWPAAASIHPDLSPEGDPMTEVLVAKKSFAAFVDGKRYLVRKDVTRVHPDHPVVRGREHLFAVVTPSRGFDVTAPVEQATAAPGERRTLTTPPEPVETGAPADSVKASTKDIRRWAQEQGLDVPDRGRIPADIIELYEAEHGEGS